MGPTAPYFLFRLNWHRTHISLSLCVYVEQGIARTFSGTPLDKYTGVTGVVSSSCHCLSVYVCSSKVFFDEAAFEYVA